MTVMYEGVPYEVGAVELRSSENTQAYSDSAEIKMENIYSTDETLVGMWIDGRPLYRKVVEFTASVVNIWANVLTPIENAEVKTVDAYIHRNLHDIVRIGQLGDTYSSIMYNVDNPAAPLGLNYYMTDSSLSGVWYAIIEYTKNID